MYDNIQQHAVKAQNEKQLLIVLGDFNCKVGEYIQGNNDTVTKGGRLLLKTMRKNSLHLQFFTQYKRYMEKSREEKRGGEKVSFRLHYDE